MAGAVVVAVAVWGNSCDGGRAVAALGAVAGAGETEVSVAVTAAGAVAMWNCSIYGKSKKTLEPFFCL